MDIDTTKTRPMIDFEKFIGTNIVERVMEDMEGEESEIIAKIETLCG